MGDKDSWEIWERRRLPDSFRDPRRRTEPVSFDVLCDDASDPKQWAVKFRDKIQEVYGRVTDLAWDRGGNPYFRIIDSRGDSARDPAIELWHLQDGQLPGLSVRFRSIVGKVQETSEAETAAPLLYGTAVTAGFSRAVFLGNQVFSATPYGRSFKGVSKFAIFEQPDSSPPNIAYIGKFNGNDHGKSVVGVNGVFGEEAEEIQPVRLFEAGGQKKLLYVTESAGGWRIMEWDKKGERILHRSKTPVSHVVLENSPSLTIHFMENGRPQSLLYSSILGQRTGSSGKAGFSGRGFRPLSSFDDGGDTLIPMEELSGSWTLTRDTMADHITELPLGPDGTKKRK